MVIPADCTVLTPAARLPFWLLRAYARYNTYDYDGLIDGALGEAVGASFADAVSAILSVSDDSTARLRAASLASHNTQQRTEIIYLVDREIRFAGTDVQINAVRTIARTWRWLDEISALASTFKLECARHVFDWILDHREDAVTPHLDHYDALSVKDDAFFNWLHCVCFEDLKWRYETDYYQQLNAFYATWQSKPSALTCLKDSALLQADWEQDTAALLATQNQQLASSLQITAPKAAILDEKKQKKTKAAREGGEARGVQMTEQGTGTRETVKSAYDKIRKNDKFKNRPDTRLRGIVSVIVEEIKKHQKITDDTVKNHLNALKLPYTNK